MNEGPQQALRSFTVPMNKMILKIGIIGVAL